jgi:hypothetical protein
MAARKKKASKATTKRKTATKAKAPASRRTTPETAPRGVQKRRRFHW